MSGLWEEELVKEMGSGRVAAGLGHICLEEGKPFSLQHKKGTVGQAGLQQGGWGLRWSAGRSGKTKRLTRPTFKKLENNKGMGRQEGWEDISPGDA